MIKGLLKFAVLTTVVVVTSAATSAVVGGIAGLLGGGLVLGAAASIAGLEEHTNKPIDDGVERPSFGGR